jgi:peptide-methionine (R)-S-oxide reductase
MRKFVVILIVAAGTAAGWAAFSALVARAPDPGRLSAQEEKPMNDKAKTTDKEWEKTLSPDQYKVLRMCGTERPFSGKYNDFWEEGAYACAGCGTPLFASKAKYEHGTGWPSFFEPIDVSRLELREDRSYL